MPHDIDAYFAHLDKLGYDRAEEQQWWFTFRSPDLEHLTRIGESLEDEFQIELQEEVETWEAGRMYMGPPMLSVGLVAALTPVDVAALQERFAALAREEGVTYGGFNSYAPIDEEALFGWLDLEAGIWRLRQFTDTGLEEGAEIPLVFAIAGGDEAALESAAIKLEKLGYAIDALAEADDEPGTFVLIVRCQGRNDDDVVTRRYAEAEAAAAGAGATLLGIQFFDADQEDEHDEVEDEVEDEDEE